MLFGPSRIDKRDHDVANALGDRQALVVVRQSARVDQRPAQPEVGERTIVANETAATTLATITLLDLVNNNNNNNNIPRSRLHAR